MEDWRSCENCGKRSCSWWILNMKMVDNTKCDSWKPILCRCGGTLSTTRYHNGRPYRHCYSCHMEFYEEGT